MAYSFYHPEFCIGLPGRLYLRRRAARGFNHNHLPSYLPHESSHCRVEAPRRKIRWVKFPARADHILLYTYFYTSAIQVRAHQHAARRTAVACYKVLGDLTSLRGPSLEKSNLNQQRRTQARMSLKVYQSEVQSLGNCTDLAVIRHRLTMPKWWDSVETTWAPWLLLGANIVEEPYGQILIFPECDSSTNRYEVPEYAQAQPPGWWILRVTILNSSDCQRWRCRDHERVPYDFVGSSSCTHLSLRLSSIDFAEYIWLPMLGV